MTSEPASDPSVFTAVPDGARRQTLLELTEKGPVHRVTLPGGQEGWLVTGYDEARAALTDPRVSRGASGKVYGHLAPEAARGLHHHMLNANPPAHTRLRKLVAGTFTRRRLELLAPTIEAISAELVAAMRIRLDAGGTVDLVEDYAFRFTFRVLCALVGIPRLDEARLSQLFTLISAGPATRIEDYRPAAQEMLGLLRSLIAEKRRSPGEDLLSGLVAARDGDDRLTEDELTSMVWLLMVAGHETTAGLIVNGFRQLLEHPDQRAALRDDPDLLPGAIEEMLRFDGPLQATLPAVAEEPLELGGHFIEAGSLVMVSPLGAGLGPRPEPFEVGRTDPRHLAFGFGIHHCLGAPLARWEARVAFRDLLRDLDDVEQVDDALARQPSLVFNRIVSLRVRTPR
ncbi:cytochrome P450 family protein [Cryptosporangium phraense]|uniref:Cytochrome P450 n=1 Tax=Cryptosporangium phraense TaxID=2593070 RepID=A0A545AUS2_9ACTN|nr:cytochrome P450 [Cryptosporangium phraense]TQS45072.1 cytochrome P450 [Cryptosporangium phraense]